MVIHTGGHKRKAAPADLETGDRGNSFAQFGSKDVPQFAPNFSVYVLPPDVVCLYSEDRKFILHGELYCALASAIGAGNSFRQIARELERDFPFDKIQEALKRLVDRRYVVSKLESSTSVTAAYWASLGLPPGVAEKNLQKCRVRMQLIDAKGAKELATALNKLGVRVVTRSADLTVTLVNDYLEGQLTKLNRQHLSDHTPWLLVQPTGVFPLVGPVFSPGKGACWTCLAERMKRNREVRAMLDRKRGALRRGFAAQAGLAWTERHPACGRRDREGDRHRFPHAIERSHHQPRSVGRDDREALLAGPPAMSVMWQ